MKNETHKLDPDHNFFFSPFSISNIEKMSALRANSYVSSKNLECYAFCRPFSGTKLLNLGVKFPKLFSPLRGDACKPKRNLKKRYFKWGFSEEGEGEMTSKQ